MSRLAVVGIGDLGGTLLRNLAQMPEVSRLYALDVDEVRLAAEVADAAAVSSYAEPSCTVHGIAVDMRNIGSLAAELARVKPDVVVNTATLQSWWVITQLPRRLWRQLEEQARFGPWLPMHLTLALNLMRALKMAGLAPAVVNVAFPDAVNPVLAGLASPPRAAREIPISSAQGFGGRRPGA